MKSLAAIIAFGLLAVGLLAGCGAGGGQGGVGEPCDSEKKCAVEGLVCNPDTLVCEWAADMDLDTGETIPEEERVSEGENSEQAGEMEKDSPADEDQASDGDGEEVPDGDQEANPETESDLSDNDPVDSADGDQEVDGDMAEAEADTTEVELEAEPEAEAESEIDGEPETDGDSSDNDPVDSADGEQEVDGDMAEAETDVTEDEMEAETDTLEVESETEPETEAESEIDAEVETEGEAEAEVEIESEIEAETEAELSDLDFDGFVPVVGYCDVNQCFPTPPTNQTACYDNSSSIACPDTGGSATCGATAFCGQDAQYPDRTRTYTCYNAGGVVTPCANLPAASNNEVVSDSLTGLMWQRTWGSSLTWQQALDYCGTTLNAGSGYAGHKDWRLPNRFELQSLVDYGRYSPAIDITVFPGTPSNWFWSASSYASYTNGAWGVDFNDGRVNVYDKTDGYNARCARGGPGNAALGAFGISPPATSPPVPLSRVRRGWPEGPGEVPPFAGSTPAERFAVTEPVVGEQVVTDAVTGLTWQKKYATGGIWQQALAYCESLTYGGQSDWRLPNVQELSGLVNVGRYFPAASDFPDMPSSDWFWSASSLARLTNGAWGVDFYYGYVGYYDKTYASFVRCVRGGP